MPGLSIGAILGYLQIEGAAQADKDVLKVQSSLNLAGEAAQKMGASVGESEAALTGAGKAAGLASTQSGKLRAAQLSVVAAQERYNVLLAEGNASTGKLATAEASLIRANGRLTTSQNAVADSQKAVAASTESVAVAASGAEKESAGLFETMGGGVETAAKLGLALTAFEALSKAIETVKGGADFQREMLLVQTQAGATAAEVQKMSAAILELAGPVATAPTELATSIYHMESVGLSGAQALEALTIAAKGAKIGNADLEQTTNALTSTVASGIPGVQNLSQAMGALNAIVGSGDMNLEQLNEALGSGVLTVVKGYGLSITDVGAALATFGDNNIRGADAATMLRMAVQAMAVPAKEGADTLAALGLQTDTLAKDMQTGGLNKAVQDLKAHLDASGVSAVQAGEVLTDTFGKKAGPGVAVLIGQVGRFETKLDEVSAGANNFDAEWTATTKTASFAFQQLATEAEVAGIKIFDKLEGPITDAAEWLGENLPRAVAKTQHALEPLEAEVGAVLVPAWHALSDILGLVSGDLSSVGDFLDKNRNSVTIVGGAVLGMWAAYKGYTIVKSAVTAVSGFLDSLMSKSIITAETVTSMASLSTLALGGIGIALGAASYLFMKHQEAVQAAKQAVQQYTQAINDDKGALGEHTRAMVEDALQSSDAYDQAKLLGISQQELTDAVMGNKDAMSDVNEVLKDLIPNYQKQNAALYAADPDKFGDGMLKASEAGTALTKTLNDQTGALAGAVDAAKNKAAADGQSTAAIGALTAATADATAQYGYQLDATGNLVYAQIQATDSTDDTSTAMDDQTQASKLLKSALDQLNGAAMNVESTQDALTESLLELTDKSALAQGANGKASASLDQNTIAGVKNREMIVNLIDAANQHAQAVADSTSANKGLTAGLQAGAATLTADEGRLRAAAAAAGLNKDQVNAMVAAMGKVPKVTDTTVNVDTSGALQKIAAVQQKLTALKETVNASTGDITDAQTKFSRDLPAPAAKPIPKHATGGTLAPGWNIVGDQGFELANGTTGEVKTNSQSQAILSAGNDAVAAEVRALRADMNRLLTSMPAPVIELDGRRVTKTVNNRNLMAGRR